MLMKPRWMLALVSLLVCGLVGGHPLGADRAAPAPSTGSTQTRPAAAGDWPMFGHDIARTNYNAAETLIGPGQVNQLVPRWQANIGGNGSAFSAPIVSNGRVYVASNVSSGNNFFGFNAVTGTPATISNLGYFNSSCFNVGIGGTPAISGTLIVAPGGDQPNAHYFGVDANTGAPLWSNAMNVGSSGFPWESPLLDYGRAYVGMSSRCDNPSVRGELRAVDLTNGATLNSAYFVNPGGAGGGIWNSPVMSPDHSVLIVATGEDYSCTVCSLTRSMVSLDPLTLAVLQHHQEGPAGQDSDYGTTPLIFHDAAGRGLVGANHKNGVFYAYVISNLNAGATWSRSIGTSVGSMPAYDPNFGAGGTLFIQGSSAQLYAVDPANGNNRWGVVSVTSGYHGNIAIANGLLFINTGSTVEIRSEVNGSLLRTITPFSAGSSNSGIVIANGFLYWVSGAFLNAWSLPAAQGTPTPTATPTWTATPTPEALLVGHVTWQGRPPQPNAANQLPITFTLRMGANPPATYANQMTDASGFFTVPVTTLPNGVYTGWGKGPQYLATSGSVSLTGAPTTQQEMGLQWAGDVNNDNLVDVTDYTLLRATFGLVCGNPGYDGRADFTGDCLVDVGDFALLSGNFGQSGPPPP